jgi:hypothetical protein
LFVLKHYLSISLEKHLQKAVWSIFNDKQTDIDKKTIFNDHKQKNISMSFYRSMTTIISDIFVAQTCLFFVKLH